MPVDPQIQMLLTLRAALPPLHTLTVQQAREQFAARNIPGLRIPDVSRVTNRDMQGPGGSLPLRIYTPLGEGGEPNGGHPLMVFFHGSGFVVCSLDTHDGMCRNLCAGTGCVVVSVDYRLAPEHKFPAGSMIAWRRPAGRWRMPQRWGPTRGACFWPATARAAIWPPSPPFACAIGWPALLGQTPDLSGNRLS